MNETQKRIKAYQDALPGIRERIVAVTLLLVMSLTMMASASFAWLTISRAPAVMGVNTTVAANGNLEIALASGDGTTAPGDSMVGDSFAREGQTVVASNQTWGNLINLGDPAYGLENLTMRPAQLNTADLLGSPLFAAAYDTDGRITELTSDFGYAAWVPPEGKVPGYFGTSDQHGVRAISSMELQAMGADIVYYDMVDAAKKKNLAAGSTYLALGDNDKYMPSLATMMGLYMTARMNPSNATLSNPDCAVADIQNLRDMYAAFLGAFDQEAEAIAALANLQLFLLKGTGNYTPYTKEMIYATTTAKLKAEGIQVTNLDQFIKDRNTIASDLEKLKDLCSSGSSLKWKDSGLNDIVNNLVNVGACTIGADNTPISSIGASNAMGYLSGTQEARITNGILYRFEERVGAYIEVKNLSISATVERSGFTIPATVKANIQTTAPRNYNLFNNDQTYAESLNTGDYVGGTYVAVDTYGLAVDLWVRTNASGSYLTLEGNVITKSEMIRATGTDANGNEVELYTVSMSGTDEETGEAVTITMDVYSQTAEDNTVTWYNAVDHRTLSDEELNGQEPVAKMVEKITVIGYEGENRIWDDSKQLSSDATTQGSGSCYVYYADTPEDQARSLTLLEAFNVAFVDGNGQLLCTAVMDTEHYYAQSGRVIVPLVLSPSNSINLGEDYTGEVTYAITALERNVPTRVTALVYLDGTKLTNDEVLSAADIQGQLNIQFGSSKSLQPIDNEKLEGESRSVSASVSETSFNYDTHEGDMKTTVTVTVDGDEPGTVTAFFLREISATQGAREDTMTFTKNAERKWVADYTFKTPGNYVLRTVRLDGVDYDLASPPRVEIEGFTVKSLSCDQAVNNHISVMTAASSSPVDVRLEFATNDVSKMPRTVQGRFLRDDGSATNINFTYNSTTGFWTGSAAFLSSGQYSMQYLVLDGEYTELDENLWQTATVYLGMKAAVYTTSPHSFKYVPSEMADNEKLLGMQVKIMADTGKEMPGLSGVKLTYGMKGSGTKKMDADLAWNGSYYVGEMQNGRPGVWQFSHVTVGSNTITTATTFPTFTILSPEPPEYYTHSTVGYQYKPNNDAVMNAQITNSAAAQVQAYIVKAGTEDGVWVTGTIGGEYTTSDGTAVNNWNFKAPADANGYQDGNWQLTQLKLWDVFDKDGNAYTEEEPLLLDVPDGNVTKVVSRIVPSFAVDKSQNFGKDASGNVTASFMTSHTISGLNVDIKDFAGEALVDPDGNLLVTDVKLTFTYVNGSSSANGGYTSDSLTNATDGATIEIPLTNDGSDTHFVQTADAKILYAGSYTTTFSFKVSGTAYTYTGSEDTDSTKALPANAPVFSVWSKAPMLTITGITPTGKYSVDNTATAEIKDTNKTESASWGQTTTKWTLHSSHTTATSNISDDKLTANVYFKCFHADDGSWSSTGYGVTGERYHAHSNGSAGTGNPSVKITLSGINGFTKATLNFNDNTHIYEKMTVTNSGIYRSITSTNSIPYSWTAAGDCTRYIGYSQNIEGRLSDTVSQAGKKTVAGTITANQLSVEYSGSTYVIKIPTITINNPY